MSKIGQKIAKLGTFIFPTGDAIDLLKYITLKFQLSGYLSSQNIFL